MKLATDNNIKIIMRLSGSPLETNNTLHTSYPVKEKKIKDLTRYPEGGSHIPRPRELDS